MGRNFGEILCVIDSLQPGHKSRIATAADWRPSDKVINPPSIPDEKAKDMFPQSFETIKPYLRMVAVV
ncbi:hypothetical protein [Erythrobacter neustonensis]|uniref:Uncharacterized protein n=1 Tax=Erythrobacter neustonensis TaxID=1112 RepID=A0A192D750_9SPHN|nr:hypothetical protein [Erythrobacter neustonensis]ANK13935.1 hypothetical protein A9D12_14270 [Erythrobacter neustonensis]